MAEYTCTVCGQQSSCPVAAFIHVNTLHFSRDTILADTEHGHACAKCLVKQTIPLDDFRSMILAVQEALVQVLKEQHGVSADTLTRCPECNAYRVDYQAASGDIKIPHCLLCGWCEPVRIKGPLCS